MEKFVFDAVSRTLTITAKFAAMMNNPASDEYLLVAQFQKDFPGLRIAKRTHRTPTRYTTKSGETYNRNQFKDLTYDRMEKFMSVLPQKEAYLTEYSTVKAFAKAAKNNGYSLVREWFVAQFPHYRKNPMFYLKNTPVVLLGSDFLESVATDDEQEVVNNDIHNFRNDELRTVPVEAPEAEAVADVA